MLSRAAALVAVLALSALLMSSCAQSGRLTVEGGVPGADPGSQDNARTPQTPQRGPRPPVNWEMPYRGGVVVASAAEAERHVDFQVTAPTFGRDPERIQVSDLAQVPRPERSVGMVFNFPQFGQVLLEQQMAHLTLENLRKRADSPDAPADAFEMVAVRGTEGLLVSWDGVGRLTWIENGVLFNIMGPTITPEQVQELAAQV